MYTTKDLKRISNANKYDSKKNTKEYKDALKENQAKTFTERLQYRKDNIKSKNKYSGLSKTNLAWFITELLVIYVASGESDWNITLAPLYALTCFISVAILSSFNALRCARVYKLGIYKKSNMVFLILHIFMFLSSLLYCIKIGGIL